MIWPWYEKILSELVFSSHPIFRVIPAWKYKDKFYYKKKIMRIFLIFD